MPDQLSSEIPALEPVQRGALFPLPRGRRDPTPGVQAALGTPGNTSAVETEEVILEETAAIDGALALPLMKVTG